MAKELGEILADGIREAIQCARLAALEEAARSCDLRANGWRIEERTPTGRYSYDAAIRARQAEEDAAAIRELKEASCTAEA